MRRSPGSGSSPAAPSRPGSVGTSGRCRGLAANSCGGSAGLAPDFPVASHGHRNTPPAPPQRGHPDLLLAPIAISATLPISCDAADLTSSSIEEPCRSMLPAREVPACRASKPVCAANCAARCCSTGSAAGATRTDASIYQIEPLGVVVPEDDQRCRGGAGDRARGGRAGAAARRRHLAMRPDGGARAGDRLQQAPARHPRVDPEARTASGGARRRAGSAERRAAPARAVLPGRSLDREPRDDRRHGRQQQLRLALDPLRQHGRTTCARSTRSSPTAPQRASAWCPAISATMRCPSGYRELVQRHARAAPPRGRGDRRAVPEAAAPGRRLQHRHASIARPATTWRTCWSARRARSPSSARSNSTLQPIPPHGLLGICQFPTFYQRDGGGAAHRRARSRARSSWSIAR